jgi:hypothetical protein
LERLPLNPGSTPVHGKLGFFAPHFYGDPIDPDVAAQLNPDRLHLYRTANLSIFVMPVAFRLIAGKKPLSDNDSSSLASELAEELGVGFEKTFIMRCLMNSSPYESKFIPIDVSNFQMADSWFKDEELN